MNSVEVIDITVFIIYILGICLFGISFYRSNKTSNKFITGGGKIPSWVVSFSIFATFVSSISYLGLPGSAFSSNWNAFAFSLSLPIAAIIAAVYFVPLYRNINSASAYTYMEKRYGSWARIYVSACYLLTQIMRIGTILYLLGLTLNAFIEIDLSIVIILTGLIVGVYSIFGGIQAVVWTDAIQGIILIFGAIICIIFILYNSGQGPDEIMRIAYENNKFSLGEFSTRLSVPTFWIVLIYGLFINIQNFGTDQNYIQRYLLTDTDKKAKYSAFLGGLIYVPVSALFLFIGTVLYGYYQTNGLLPIEISETADKVFPYFIVNTLPVGFKGLLIASIFAAGMSTLSTSYNSSATILLIDYYNKYFNKKRVYFSQMHILYGSTILIALLGISVALAMINIKSALDAWWKLASIFSGGMLGLFLLGFLTKVKGNISPVIGTLVGVLSILVLSIPEFFKFLFGIENPFHNYLVIVIGTSIIFLTGFLFMIIFKKTK